eukprot:TRINITY_DN55960_c0_g1_i1.p1 TRINITY_DN55960_c0_g1~~TRINITY_DN55960_c0_g1_i1.p1  ORF type:complete len:257 (-),score=70.58 TRINITY_DN55960_c0_g1_i1:62-832(-)
MGASPCCSGRPENPDRAFKDSGQFNLSPVTPPPGAGPQCSCSAFKANGSCRHLPPALGGLAREERKPDAEPELEAPKRVVLVQKDRIAWYRERTKSITPRPGKRCGIFLDIDGVVHPLGAWGKDSFCRMQLLQEIVKETGCDIVLSSSWRADDEGVQEINDRLRELAGAGAGEAAELLDVTGPTTSPLNELGNRDQEILEWVKSYASQAGWEQRWLALDDLDLTPSLGAEHAVVTDGEVGLTEPKVREAIEKLKGL